MSVKYCPPVPVYFWRKL